MRLNGISARLFGSASASAILLGSVMISSAEDAPIVLPGAPGEDVRSLSAEEAIAITASSFSPDDVRFMRNMIPHHGQAIEMANLVEGRTAAEGIVTIAGKIKATQSDEIDFMRGWLAARGQGNAKTEGSDGHNAHGQQGGHSGLSEEMMSAMGMASMAQMAELEASEGVGFDQLFLTLMIRHHEGAVDMVTELLEKPGSAYDPVLLDFTTDITNDQTREIEQMSAMLAQLSPDPRSSLTPGYLDAGEAILNLEKIASLPRPAGFFDPANPAGLQPLKKAGDEAEADNDEERDDEDGQSLDGTQWSERTSFLSFSNTDMAFFDDKMIAGNYHGFNIYDLDDNGEPELMSSVVCPGGQGDVSVVGDLLIMSVEQLRGRVDCGLQGVGEDISDERFRGLRIFDISDLTRPVQVGQVQTCRGSHTHSVVSSDETRIVVYNSGTAIVRDEAELEGCIGEVPGDDRTALFRVDVIEIPVANPAASRIVSSPAVFADEETGRLAGLWQGGDHGDDTQTTNSTNHCHDITVFPELNLAAGACSGNGIIFDISDPLDPKRLDDVVDAGFAYWHSATFNNDGTKVLFTDEWGGGSRPRCRAQDPLDWGADAIYNIEDGKLVFQGYYKIAAPQLEEENCVAHNGSIIPVPGRDIFAQAWYQGGLSVVDFTDATSATEIAYFDRGPIDEQQLVLGGYWSTYWYNGKIYGTEIARGVDVFALEPSEYLTENEIAAAALADQGDLFNPQQQFQVTWPAEPVVAKAYVDQLERDVTLSEDRITELRAVLDDAEARLDRRFRRTSASIADNLDTLVAALNSENPDSVKIASLADVMSKIATRLR
ncbi:MAG: DUF305 domain-containing protein [Pseudomonadota bacterium]